MPRPDELLGLARDRLACARLLVDAGYSRGAASAAYWAVFSAARAALAGESVRAKTHHGVWLLFDREFVASGRFDAELHGAARRMQTLRESADGWAEPIRPEEAEGATSVAVRFVREIDRLLLA